MGCFHPLTAYQHVTAPYAYPLSFKPVPGWKEIQVSCGQCIGCRLNNSRQWAIRCMHEASLHPDNCFLTLTYDPKKRPEHDSLNLDHIQKFLKLLRYKVLPQRIRFFQCGEYGEDNGMPHHHVIIFGYDFPDKEIFFKSRKSGCTVYRSPMLESIWQHGFSSIGDVTFESAAYVARYCLKKMTGPGAAEFYGEKKPEFITMSRRPGIGTGWISKYMDDVYPKDFITMNDGEKVHPAKFYDKFFEKNHGHMAMKKIKEKRVYDVVENKKDLFDVARLRAKEECSMLRLKSHKRNLSF